MNPWLILTGLIAAISVVFICRTIRPGSGQRRFPLDALPSVEALTKFQAHCLAEQRSTLHVRFGTGATQCLECRNTSGGRPDLGMDAGFDRLRQAIRDEQNKGA